MQSAKPKTTTTKLAAYIDVAGQPDVDQFVVVCGVWCERSSIRKIGSFLQQLRDMNRYQRSMHFNELGKMKSCGGQAHLALDWIRAVINDSQFNAHIRCLLVDCQDFDMKWYGNKRATAINRLIKTYMLGCLPIFCKSTDNIDLRVYVDGHSSQYESGTGLLDYLNGTLNYNSRIRSSQPNIEQLSVKAVQRSPLTPRGSRRRRQDMVALADLVAGATRFHAQPTKTDSVKPVLADVLHKGLGRFNVIPRKERAFDITRYTPPRTYEALVPYMPAAHAQLN